MSNHINYTLAPGDVLLTCPYDKAHEVLKERFVRHLDKCRKNYRKQMQDKGNAVKSVACPYNFQHQMLEPELEYHMKNCPDSLAGLVSVNGPLMVNPNDVAQLSGSSFSGSKTAWASKPVSGASWNSAVKAQPSKKPGASSAATLASKKIGEEDWESEARTDFKPCYDPKVKLAQGNIMYIPQGLTKSEKKAHREKIRRQNASQGSGSSGGYGTSATAAGSSSGKPYIPVGAPGWKA